MLTNQDSCSSLRPMLVNDIVPNPWINPNEMKAKDTLIAPKISLIEIPLILCSSLSFKCIQ